MTAISKLATERVEGPTPHGGAYAIATFLNDKNEAVTKALATRINIVEYDAGGQEIFRTYSDMRSPGPNDNSSRIQDAPPGPPVIPDF